MSLKTNFELMAHYNQWMNDNIYRSCTQLSDAQLQENAGAFFGSIIATLNHILVADTLWLKRFAAHPSHYQSITEIVNQSSPTALNQILYSDLKSLTNARIMMDKTIIAFIDEIKESDLEQVLSYKNVKGEEMNKRFGSVLHHFFNHQTHHRGQVTTLLHQKGIDVGVTDLLAIIPNT